MKVTVEHSAQMAAMREAGIPVSKIVMKFENLYSRATVYRHSSIRLGQPARADRRVNNKGRPRKLSERDERRVLRSIPELRRSEEASLHAGLQAKPGSLPMIYVV